MKASETSLSDILSGKEQQYLVPLFQRTYSWGGKPLGEKPWNDLWEDISNLFETEDNSELPKMQPTTHFLGSIVTIPTEQMPQNMPKYLLIDGQQRLTTLSILLAAIRDMVTDPELKGKIEKHQLINEYKRGNDKYKLLPTQQDRPAFEAVINGDHLSKNQLKDSLIVQCYRFFEKKIKARNTEVEQLYQAVINQLTVVSITLNADENPHLIFESLNARGMVLTEADLIRNYFLMRVDVAEQENVFKNNWQPMQDNLKENLTEFMRHYLMAMRSSFVKQDEVYLTLKQDVEKSKKSVLESLKEIASFAECYHRILDPKENESESSIQQALIRIKRNDVTVTYPFLLKCYQDFSKGTLSAQEFVIVLHSLENFLVRRAVCNVPTHGLNKLFPTIYRQVEPRDETKSFSEAVADFLQSKNYPSDDEFTAAFSKFKSYADKKANTRTRLILESLELSYRHKECVDFKETELEIEHVMPQTLNEWWKHHLGQDWETTHNSCLHAIGNLTLTAYNKTLSNGSFPDKQQIFSESHFVLNRYFSELTEWKKEQIEERTQHLANLALKVWPYFGSEKQSGLQSRTHKVTGTEPFRVRFKDQQISVKTWRGVLEGLLNYVAEDQPSIFAALASKYPRFVGQEANAFYRCTKLKNGYFAGINLSAENIYDFCHKMMSFCGYREEDWQIDYE